ncbi:MAG: radical SAM protein [Deltaproteobacteria bacterium]|jgi:uncharacterized protein|nr:radical SAM protein [Deltaproteobacteria bacterium]
MPQAPEKRRLFSLPAPSRLVLILTRRCNLGCGYCYNGEADESLMSRETLERAFALLAEGEGPFGVQLTGGEPLLVPELVERACALFKKAGEKRPGALSLQTNLTLLNEDWLDLFRKYRVDLGVSLDGPPEINERQRGKSRELFRSLELLRQSAFPFSATAVVTRENCAHLGALVLFLGGFKEARGLGLDLLVKKGRRGLSPPRAPALNEAAGKIRESLALVNRFRFRPFRLRELEMLRKAEKGGGGSFCGACRGTTLAVTPEGELYPCAQAAGEEEFSLGGLERPRAPRKSPGAYELSTAKCLLCPLHGRCPGECPTRLRFNRGEEDLVCSLYRGLSSLPLDL